FLLLHKEQCVEHNRFSEGNGQNGLDQDLSRRAGIASHNVRSFHANHTPCNCGPERRQTYVQISVHGFVVPFSPTAVIESTVRPPKFIIQSCTTAGPSASCWQISRVKTAVNNVNTRACTTPT